jgi:hypothetical protein
LLAAGERDPLPLTIGMLFGGMVAFILDLRWWLWLRHADPVTAYERLQTREERERSARGHLAAAFSVVFVLLWYLVR